MLLVASLIAVTAMHHCFGEQKNAAGVDFDVEAFFGSVLVATFQTSDPANMKRFLGAYLSLTHPEGGDDAQKLFESAWQRQEEKITKAMAAVRSKPSR